MLLLQISAVAGIWIWWPFTKTKLTFLNTRSDLNIFPFFHYYDIIVAWRSSLKPCSITQSTCTNILLFEFVPSPDTKNSSGLIGCIEEVAHNAICIYWNPLESSAKVIIRFFSLVDFSRNFQIVKNCASRSETTTRYLQCKKNNSKM